MSDGQRDAYTMLEATSRTFFTPIVALPDGLREAVMSGYLCLRAIDEIEDHPSLHVLAKRSLLEDVSRLLQSDGAGADFDSLLSGIPDLHEVTLHLYQWLRLAPKTVAPRICDATAAMADRMAMWAGRQWRIDSSEDLDWYTFSVAGAAGLLLSDLWAWYDGTATPRPEAVGFGRGLQATNILLNRSADLDRGVDFFPPGWLTRDMHDYAQRNLRLAESYVACLPDGPVRHFCQVPLALAWPSVDAVASGISKLTRAEVNDALRHFGHT